MNRPEEILHRQVADYLRIVKPKALWFHCPNGARMSKAQAGIHKALGMLAGVPDLVFVCHGGRVAFIELKAPKGTLSDAQKTFKETAEALGCDYAVCRSVDQVMVALAEWGLITVKAQYGIQVMEI
jgi:hypothetical protein